MAKCILVGCDLHDRSMLLKVSVGGGKSSQRSWANKAASRRKMIGDLWRRARGAGCDRIVFAYEACGFGFVLWDELTAAGIEAYVLAPTRMERSVKQRRNKTDERDAEWILERVKSYVLAGVALPSVWVPDRQTRDDRELVRRRLEVAEKVASVKSQIRWLLKRQGMEKPSWVDGTWTASYRRWLDGLVAEVLSTGASGTLESLLRQLDWLCGERSSLDASVASLSQTDRYAGLVLALTCEKGVGVLTAMTFLTELGDLTRFSNRRQLASYLGLTPSMAESGQWDDRKGHITRQGPSRVRKVLCQAVWSRLGSLPEEMVAYQRLVERNPKQKKIAVVARMRCLAIRLWHVGVSVQRSKQQQAVA